MMENFKKFVEMARKSKQVYEKSSDELELENQRMLAKMDVLLAANNLR